MWTSTVLDSQLKDNPAFSMLNDSDDEVIYGYVLCVMLPEVFCSEWFSYCKTNKNVHFRSDYEEMPLQNGRAIKATAKYQDESDSDWSDSWLEESETGLTFWLVSSCDVYLTSGLFGDVYILTVEIIPVSLFTVCKYIYIYIYMLIYF